METAEIQEFIGLVAALRACQGKGTSHFRWMRASTEHLDFFADLPVFASVPELAPILREAKRVGRAAEEEVFGRRSARATAAMPGTDSIEVSVRSHKTDTRAFTSPVPAPVTLSPQPAFTPKPAEAFALVLTEPEPAFFQLVFSTTEPAFEPVFSTSEPAFEPVLSEPEPAFFQPVFSSPEPAFPPNGFKLGQVSLQPWGIKSCDQLFQSCGRGRAAKVVLWRL